MVEGSQTGVRVMNLKTDDNESIAYVPSIEEQRGYWDDRWEKNSSPNEWQRRRGEMVCRLIESLSLSRPDILDLGCATGWFTERLSHMGEVLGIDLSESAISIAKARYPGLKFAAGNIFNMSLGKGVYDVVVSQEVVAHVENQKEFIEGIASILRPKGYLVITSANKIVMKRVDHGQDPREHIKQWLSMGEIKRLIRPHFLILRSTSIIPMGDRGFLRLVNSHKVNAALGLVIPMKYLEALKERVGLGYSLIILAQRK
jgi:2-polyprenyl-3-methyl-5-hydroxy-6-metoxy-1,4-benzoquinol methylase